MGRYLATTVGILVISFVAYNCLKLKRLVHSAKSTGLPYVIVPFLETEVLSQLVTPLLRNYYLTHLEKGEGWPRWCRFMIKDWTWEDKRRAFQDHGDVFLAVSPQGIICYCADANMAFDVMNRRYDFIKPRDKYQMLEPYGPNVVTAEGGTYRFHVRMVAPSFGDITGVNDLVWQETLRQTGLLMDRWTNVTPKELDTDINALTLAIISLAGFGQMLESVEEQKQDIPPGYKISFLAALRSTTQNILFLLLFPGWLLDLTPYAEANLAKQQLEKYLRTLIKRERAKEVNEKAELLSRTNLLHTVVNAVDTEGGDTETAGVVKKKTRFNEDEVMGNLFIYMLAGYETTANSIQYGILVLAAHQNVQTKCIEEIDRVYEEVALAGRHELSYNEDFAKLEYIFGFMYEVSRLYPGVILITKMCTSDQTMHLHDDRTNQTQAHVLPAGCRVYLSSPGVHYHEKYWKNSHEFDPTRWFTDKFSRQGGEEKHVVAADRTRQMRGTLLTFSDGARACLGRKFAQAEFMAFFATILRRFRVTFKDGADADRLRSDIVNKSAGKIVSLTPLPGFPIELRQRVLA
ncbi:putative cytochrome P450 oxidoreductase [Cucurbitaria berberidis CBS 394.84]|uniref:Cytochrome P450 oxidoreductase n=1 Tax=Cucurbitaria berberidis CBS 394.84 TaxID=1168544 RepID=A0A9P4GLH1_9PLEO|nr:putative cytochrome P450 oxidoreductase [Cucurbitaria berberidis CBS 394.84]KAF1847374.1 putative cytochrome P450 oxidoreductase [Cucurbitaria berberidis CBS 394.84]